MTRRAWVLAFDAEDELEIGAGYTASRAIRVRNERLTRLFARGLPVGDVVVDVESGAWIEGWCEGRVGALDLRECDGDGAGDGAGDGDGDGAGDGAGDGDGDGDGDTHARAWCPTPRTLRAFVRAGIAPPPAPSLSVLRRVNGRAFAHALDPDELPGAANLATLDDVITHLEHPSPTGAWLLKRELGMAGRGQRPIAPGRLDDADRAFVIASLRRGPLQIEPRVELLRELTIHGWVVGDRVVVTTVREQLLHERAWVTSRLVTLPAELELAVVLATERAGRALAELGYFGPFGVDAYEWRMPSGVRALRTIGEINARFCMDWDALDGWDPPR